MTKLTSTKKPFPFDHSLQLWQPISWAPGWKSVLMELHRLASEECCYHYSVCIFSPDKWGFPSVPLYLCCCSAGGEAGRTRSNSGAHCGGSPSSQSWPLPLAWLHRRTPFSQHGHAVPWAPALPSCGTNHARAALACNKSISGFQSQGTVWDRGWRWDLKDAHKDDRRMKRVLCGEEPREVSQGQAGTHMKSLGSILRTEWTCSKAGKLGAHILLQDCPQLLGILLHSVRWSPAQNKLDGILVVK